MRILIWFVLAAATIAACDSFEATQSYKFSGRVVDAESKDPLGDVPVLIWRYSSGKTCEFVSNKPCGEGYTRLVENTATANDGTFEFEYEISTFLSSRHQIMVDPCHLQQGDCEYDEVTLRSRGSLTDQLIELSRSEM